MVVTRIEHEYICRFFCLDLLLLHFIHMKANINIYVCKFQYLNNNIKGYIHEIQLLFYKHILGYFKNIFIIENC